MRAIPQQSTCGLSGAWSTSYSLVGRRLPTILKVQSSEPLCGSKKVLGESKTWPRGFPSEGKALVKSLLDDAPSYRLGAGRDGLDSVKRHAFFRGFDWKSLADMSQKAPYVPPIKNAMDTRNFDPYDERDPLKPFRGDQRTFGGWSEMGADFPPQKVGDKRTLDGSAGSRITMDPGGCVPVQRRGRAR